jgi:uncharacterized protein (TIGR02996 family)
MTALSFLEAIREDPADDVPRLVFADWLEDAGDYDRAEFIRVQCEWARGVRDRGRSAELNGRHRQLLEAHRAKWLGPLAELAPEAKFERGFVDDIRVSASLFLEHADAIFALHPIRTLRLERAHRILYEVAACPHLAGLDTLDLQAEPLRDDGLAILGRGKYLGRLRKLDLTRIECTGEGVHALIDRGAVAGLEELTLRHNPAMGNEGVAAIAGGLRHLRRLDLSTTGIGDEGVEIIAEAPALRDLRNLSLMGNPLGYAAVERLCESFAQRGLDILDVRGCVAGAEGLRRRFGAKVLV